MGEGKTVQRSLRSEIEYHLKDRGYTLTRLSEITGINQGVLSDLLNRIPPRSMTIGHLDALAHAFEQSQGWLYELYEAECFVEGRVSRSRVVPYLVRCAEIGRRDCIDSIVYKVLDNQKNTSILFQVAEQLFTKGKRKESVLFYKLVIDTDKNSHNERFVIAQYRLFRALQSTDSEKNWGAVIQFDPYRKRLPENYQLDALLQLANVCFSLHKWKEVERYADELRGLATAVYQDQLRGRNSNRKIPPLKTERHLVVYYGQGFLLKSAALEKQGLHKEAKEYISGYTDLSWFELLDETGQMEVDKFRLWATANRYTLDVLLGDIDILPTYTRFLIDHPKEILSGLIAIMESANKHGFLVDGILEQLTNQINDFNDYDNLIQTDRYFRFRYELAMYRLHNGQYESGMEDILRCLVLSTSLKNDSGFIRCVTLFEAFRSHATDQQNRKYKRIMEGVRNNEGDFAINSFSFGTV
ncbi:helix-turn-helix domain-containing protein [Brevibacillus brevis]|uniref:helix-turn-helix domain-containing protein n=1 Tax=Brevibacillus brevis TaxID=1393 RepID=UPI0025A51111|nr:helix-turn-helix transcriptional regulator [Brevibacillus brevis]WJQ81482.1 helix-turn-helix transcriptional regulator [Brevibacillus brevis]